MGVQVTINIGKQPIFVFPSGGDPVLGGEVTLRANGADAGEGIAIGGVKVEWEVTVERKGRGKMEWSTKEVLSKHEVTVGGESKVKGSAKLHFSLKLPANLPPTRCSEFDRLTHVVTATVLDPVPSYNDSHTHASLPPTPSSSPYASPSISRNGSRVDLSLPPPGANGAAQPKKKNLMRTVLRRHTADQMSIRQAVRRLSAAPRPREWPAEEGLARTSMNVEVIACHDGRGELRRLDWQHTYEVENLGKIDMRATSDLFILGSTVDMELVLTDLAPNATLHAASLALVQHTIGPVKRESYFSTPPQTPGLSASAGSTPNGSVPATPLDDPPPIDINLNTLPSEQLPDPTYADAVPHHPPGHLAPYSLPGSSPSWTGFEVPVLADDSPHNVTDSFRLYEAGLPHHPNENRPPIRGEYLWRGTIPLKHDKAKKGRVKSLFTKQNEKDLPEVVETSRTLRIHKRLDLPSPILGAHPSYRANPNVSRVSHKLHFALYYSILGTGSNGEDTKDKHDDGVVRVYWTEKPVAVGSCAGLSDNLVAPPYTPAPDETAPTETVKRRDRAHSIASCFVTRSRAYGPKGRERMHDVGTASKVLKERLRAHELETGGACVCFMRDESSELDKVGV